MASRILTKVTAVDLKQDGDRLIAVFQISCRKDGCVGTVCHTREYREITPDSFGLGKMSRKETETCDCCSSHGEIQPRDINYVLEQVKALVVKGNFQPKLLLRAQH